jgi:hypothetical protein
MDGKCLPLFYSGGVWRYRARCSVPSAKADGNELTAHGWLNQLFIAVDFSQRIKKQHD